MIQHTALLLVFLATPAIADPLLVASDKGVREVGLDGKTVRTLTTGKAQWPRLLPDRKGLVYFAPDQAELRRVALDTGATTTVAKLPATFRTCKKPKKVTDGEGYDQKRSLSELSVQEDGDFVIDKSGQAACLTLADGNANSVNVIVKLHVPFGEGKAALAVSLPDGCPGPKIPECKEVESAETEPPAGTYDLQDGWLVEGKKKLVKLGKKGDFDKKKISPSGTWAVIGGNEEQGDYFYNTLFLLNQKDGSISTIAAKSTVLTKEQLRTMKIKSLVADGVTTVRWLNDATLLVGSTLVWPGKGLVDLKGEIAH